MSIYFSELVARLMDDVPAENDIPSAMQYENAVKDAVADFSEQCGLEQIGTLNIVAGTAIYDLPADFMKLTLLETFFNAMDGVLHSVDGLLPVSATWTEKFTIRNGQIRFYPVPRYTMARDFSYKAAWVSTVIDDEYPDEEYATMGEREARIILLKAQEIALNKGSNAQSGSGIKYRFGGGSEDLGGTGEGSRKTAYALQSDYEAACKKYNGTVGIF